MDNPVLLTEHPTSAGTLLGHAHLNVESTLNSLSLAMVRILDQALRAWRERDDIAGVVITGAGDKAFCAGGDIQALYHAISANHAAGSIVDEYPFSFFAEEYRLDYLLHTYPKPLVTLGHGIVMGGGLGILCASRYKVLTEKSRLAVPEITIGLFPDAGATWTLGNMAPHHALFLGLTGSHVNATDSLTTGMGDYVIAHEQRTAWLQRVIDLPWQGQADDHAMLADFLATADNHQLAAAAMPAAELAQVPEREVSSDLAAEAAAVYSLAGRSKWIDRGIANLRGGCPTTAGIVVEQLRRVKTLSLAESFQMELNVASHCALHEDFREGVRALLIEKDNKPQWRYGDIAGLDWQHVLSHFAPPAETPWPEHPLADLDRPTWITNFKERQ